ncbi:MAG: diguanylate cyclase [Nitrosomonadales bacterium]|jgi:glyoxylase I family protein|nr:diguanylate cyclase [Nitrosomonadales bacterium]MBT4571439.1 diguanylate cyclase [Nitrosomonadales bacterium]MBT5149948.1 diguanylate cyclase [Nitrosomonadales bacterium]MBT6015127.1 diguanylate cyclase [Nitrosomonadales bacterium]MBT6251525.1 diguanylate cyclase [Nitrosomonadales bacterium]
MLEGLYHYNIRSDTKTMYKLKDFYTNIVGLKVGHRPAYKSDGFWLYINDKDVLHLAETKEGDKKKHHVNSTFDHAAFHAREFDRYASVLKKNEIDFYIRVVPEIGKKQIFFKDPVGNGIELYFVDS